MGMYCVACLHSIATGTADYSSDLHRYPGWEWVSWITGMVTGAAAAVVNSPKTDALAIIWRRFASRLLKEAQESWPPMNADEHRWKAGELSA